MQAYRLAHQISRDRRQADAEEAEFIAEAERLRELRERRERQERHARRERDEREQREQREQRQRQQEIVIRVDDGPRSSFDRPRRAEVGLYEPRRRSPEGYALVPESTLRELRLREEAEAYQRERELTREVVREELRAQLPILSPPRRREPRPLLNMSTGESLRRRSEEIVRPQELIYNYVENRYAGDRRRQRETSYEEVLYDDDDLGDLTYDEIEEARIRREADEYARMMRQRREDVMWEDIRRRR